MDILCICVYLCLKFAWPQYISSKNPLQSYTERCIMNMYSNKDQSLLWEIKLYLFSNRLSELLWWSELLSYKLAMVGSVQCSGPVLRFNWINGEHLFPSILNILAPVIFKKLPILTGHDERHYKWVIVIILHKCIWYAVSNLCEHNGLSVWTHPSWS